MRSKALRRRVWFGVLSKIDRGIVELTIRCVDRIRSTRLASVISHIVHKIMRALKSGFLDRAESVGRGLAEKLGDIAVSWGYAEASVWKRDLGFIRYLGKSAVNDLRGWKLS